MESATLVLQSPELGTCTTGRLGMELCFLKTSTNAATRLLRLLLTSFLLSFLIFDGTAMTIAMEIHDLKPWIPLILTTCPMIGTTLELARLVHPAHRPFILVR